jgi:type I restriction enzyme R subunit
MGDHDALAAVERLARPQTADLHRFYVDRSDVKARIVSSEEVRERAGSASDDRREWASSVEVVWAANEADAIAGGAS